MKPAHLILAVGLLASGSFNTITTNLANMQNVAGTMAPSTIWGKLNNEIETVHAFDHPYFQATGMFFGEVLCFLAYLVTRPVAARDPNIQVPGGRAKGAFWFAIPAMCDMIGTGTMYAGLCLSYPSIYQMLRGSNVIFTCVISAVFLRRKIYCFQWFSVFLLVIGVIIVGCVSLATKGTGHKDQAGVLVGDVLIIIGNLSQAICYVTEEKLMKLYPSSALKVVGLEGIFGFLILGTLLIPMYYTRIGGYPFENTPDAIAQVSNNTTVLVALIGNTISIAFFNFFGVSVTQQLSAAHRIIIDCMRTVVVWIVSLGLGWEQPGPLTWLQVVGFLILSFGSAAYNEIFKLPFFTYPCGSTLCESEQSDDSPDVSLVDGDKV